MLYYKDKKDFIQTNTFYLKLGHDRMRPDLYTSRHCQWYYFRVQNMRADTEYS